LASALARHYTVTVIDCHPKWQLMYWASEIDMDRLKFIASRGEMYIQDEIDQARRTSDFVIIDLEGMATRADVFAMGESDLVIIPFGEEERHETAVRKALAHLEREQRYLRRKIPVGFLRNQASQVVTTDMERSRSAKLLEEIDSFKTKLHFHKAYDYMEIYACGVHGLACCNQPNVDKAILDAELFAEEVLYVIRELHFANTKRDRAHVGAQVAA
jgi:chromosome partitioning protein